MLLFEVPKDFVSISETSCPQIIGRFTQRLIDLVALSPKSPLIRQRRDRLRFACRNFGERKLMEIVQLVVSH
jgi:hypothetical protein